MESNKKTYGDSKRKADDKTNAVLDKIEETIRNGIVGNEDDDW